MYLTMLCHGMSQSPEDWEKDWPKASRVFHCKSS